MVQLLLGMRRGAAVGLFLAGGMALPGEVALAEPARERPYESARAKGRGNTYVAARESDESIHMNVASLADDHKKSFQLRFLQIDGLVGQNTVDTVSDILDLNPTDTSPVSILQDFSSKFGKQQYMRLQLAPFGLRILNFDLAPFFSTANWLDMRVPTTPETRLVSDTMAGLNLGFAMRFWKQIQLGVNVRPFFRNYVDVDLEFAQIMEFEPLGDSKASDVFKVRNGSGVAFDLGGLFLVNKVTRIGLTLHDIGQTGYMLSGNKDDLPPSIPVNLGLGIHSRYELKAKWNIDGSFDLQDVLNPEELNFLRLMHIGIEFGRSYRTEDNDLGVTVGLNEGYLSFGAFVDLWVMRLDIASYGVELGEDPGQRQDRRTAISARSSLTF